MGSDFTCFVDKLETMPAQSFIFNMANISSNSFSIEYMDMEKRANAIDVTFWDKTNHHKQRTIELHAADFDTTTVEIKKTQLTLKGCTTLAEALAHGYFALNCNRFLTFVGTGVLISMLLDVRPGILWKSSMTLHYGVMADL
jgi:predicted phage tail protein